MSASPSRLRPAARLDGLGVTLIRRFMADAPSGALNLGLGMTNVDVPEAIQRAVVAAPSRLRADYGPNGGQPALRSAIARRYGVASEQVIVTCGVQEAIALTMLGVIEPGDEVAVPEPAFPVYATLARIAGGRPVPYRLDPSARFRPTWAAIEAALTPKTRLAVIVSPGNPTGAVAEPQELARIADGLAARGVPYLSDEIYLELQHGAVTHGSMWESAAEGVVVAGLAKSHGLAGWRIGWAVVPSTLVEPLLALHQHLVTSAPTLIQDAALAAFEDADAAAAPTRFCETLATRRTRAIEALVRGGWEVAAGDGAFYLWVKRSGEDDDLELATRLKHDLGVITLPGRAFGEAGRGYLRLSYSVDDAVLDEALRRLAT